MYDWKPKMQKVAKNFADQIRGIRSGTISIGLVQTIRVDCQGRSVPINRLGTVKSQGDRILITPFDRADVPSIVRTLTESRLSAYALNPTTVCVSIPPLSVEHANETARHVKKLGEDAKIRDPLDPAAGTQAHRSLRPRLKNPAPSRKQPTRRSRRSKNWSRRRSMS